MNILEQMSIATIDMATNEIKNIVVESDNLLGAVQVAIHDCVGTTCFVWLQPETATKLKYVQGAYNFEYNQKTKLYVMVSAY